MTTQNLDKILNALEDLKNRTATFFSITDDAHEQSRFQEAQIHYKMLDKVLQSIEQAIINEGIQHIASDPEKQKQQQAPGTSYSEDCEEDNKRLVRNARLCVDRLEKAQL